MSTIIFNVNGLVQKQRLSDWIKKQDKAIYYLKGTHFKDMKRLKVKYWKDIPC